MTRPNGGWRCSYGNWHDLYETCKCWESNAAVMAAAFGGPGRVEGSNDVHCWDEACEHRAWDRAEEEAEFDAEQAARAAA